MSMTLSQIQDFVRFRVGNRTDLSSGVGLTNLNLWINNAKDYINHTFRFANSTSEVTLTSVANQRYIPIPTTLSIYAILSIYDMTNSHELDPFEGDFALYERKFPTFYNAPTHWLREAARVYLYPGPDSVDTYRALAWMETADLSGANDIPPFPIVWHKAVALRSVIEAWRALDDEERATSLERGEYRNYVGTLRTPRAIESHNTRRRGVRVNRAINPKYGVR